MVKRIINRVLCTALVAALLLPSFCVDARAEEIIDISDNQEIEIVEEEVVEVEDHSISEEDTYGSSFGNMRLAFDGDPEDRIEDIDRYLGYREIPSEKDFQRYSDAVKEKGDLSLSDTLPSSYITSTLPPTRNQNPYGSCWAHAAMACAEINQKNAALNLSELHFAYFTYHTPLDPLGGLDGDSNSFISSKDFMQFGGDTVVASNVLTNWVGPANESDVPYSDAASVINGTKTISTNKAYYDAFHVQDYYYTDPVSDLDSTKRLIRDYGAVAASYYALLKGYYFPNTPYTFDNVYNETTYAYYLPLTNGTNHAITLVGWDDNFSASNFGCTPEGDGAWLVRNSWQEGKSVSQKSYESYFWLSYYDKTLSHNAVAYRVESADNYDNNYQYDGTMTTAGTFLEGSRTTCLKNANVFTAKGSLTGEQLKAVSFGTWDSDVNYTIKIYKGLTGTKPDSGSLAATLTGTTMDAGYYTIKLNNPVQLENGEKYSVVVYFDDPSVQMFAEAGNNSYGYDSNGNYYSWNCVAHIDEGESFWGYDWKGNSVWNDYATDSSWNGGNVRIKAFTTNNPSIPGMGTNVTLALDANGGTFSSGSTKVYKSVITGYEYGVMQNPTRTGYDFAGWFTEATGGSEVTKDTMVMSASDHTLYAHWTLKKVKVSVGLRGGRYNGQSFMDTFTDIEYGSKYYDFLNLNNTNERAKYTRTGYSFEDMYRHPLDGDPTIITADTVVSTEWDHVIYAHWTPNKYTLSFDARGGQECVSKEVTYDAAVGELPDTTRDGYDFDGWFTGATGGAEVTASTKYITAGDSTVYAHWTAQDVLVSFNANGGTCSKPSKYVVYDETYGELPTPVKAGYDFAGWFTGATDGSEVKADTVVKNAYSHTLYAHWTPTSVTVSFKANGKKATCPTASKMVTYLGTYGELPIPSRTGYEFAGWYTKAAAGEGSKIESTSQVDNYENHILYAHWTALQYTVSFDATDGNCDTESKQVTYEGKYGELPVATRISWDFAGWFTEPEGGVEITAQTTVSLADDHTLYAHWSDHQGDITDEDKAVLIQKYGENYEVPEGLWIAGLITYENGFEEAKKYTFTGSAIKPEVRVYDGNKMLKEKVDYSIAYKNNVNVASADKTNAKGASIAPTVTVTGKGNYKGSDTARFEIVTKAIGTPEGMPEESIIVSDPAMVLCNNRDQKPVPTITYDKKKLAAKKDFVVSYYRKDDIGDNPGVADFAGREADAVIPKDAGTYYVLLSAKEGGNYSGAVIKSFVIGLKEEVLVSKLSVKKIADKQYTGWEVYPDDDELVVKNGKEELVLGTDYTVSYVAGADYTNIGTATAIITGQGRYIGSKALTYKIVGRQMKSVKIDNFVKSFDADKSYDKTAKTMDSLELSYSDKTMAVPEEVVWKTETDYESLSDNAKKNVGCIVSYLNNTNAGTATLVLTGINAYTGTVKKTFKIAPRVMNTSDPDIVIETDNSYPYEKSGVKPNVTVYYKGDVLTPGKDYTVSYMNNAAVNDWSNPKKIPTIKITGKGNFKGTDASTQFYIEKGELNDPYQGITIAVNDVAYAKKAGNWKSNVTVTDGKGKKLALKTDYTLIYSYDDGTPINDKALLSAGTVVKVTIAGTDRNYSADASCNVSATYRIVPKDINKLKASIKNPTRAYTGKPIMPGKDEILWTGEIPDEDDFEIIGYSNNINKGKASVIIKGVGDNYGGTKTITFNITTKVFSWWPW